MTEEERAAQQKAAAAELEAMFSSMPMGGGSQFAPIGVPEFVRGPDGQPVPFAPTVQLPLPPGAMGPPSMGPVPPRYFEGHEYVPSSLPAEDIARLQRRMFGAGVMTKEEAREARLGFWDDVTIGAYRRLLGFANQIGHNQQTALDEFDRRREEIGDTGAGGLRTNPADIQALANDTAMARIGRQLRPEELSRFTRAYEATIDEANDPYAAPVPGFEEDEEGVIGGAVFAPPDPGVFAEQQIEEIAPAEQAAHTVGTMLINDWNSLIMSPVSR